MSVLRRACLVGMPLVLVARLAGAQDLRVNATVYGDQSLGSLATDGSRFRAAWRSNQGFCSLNHIAGRDLAADGALGADDFLVDTACPNTNDGAIAMLPSGIALVAMQRGGDIYGQLLDPAGAPLGAELLVSEDAPGFQTAPRVAAIPPSRFVVVWQAEQSTPQTWDSWGRIVGDDGALLAEARLPSAPADVAVDPDVAVLGSGDIVATWLRHEHPAPGRIMERRFAPDLFPRGPEVEVVTLPSTGGEACVCAAGGRYLVAWSTVEDVTVRLYDEVSGPVGGDVIVAGSPYPEFDPGCALDAAGRAIVVWSSYGQDGYLGGVFARRLDAAGALWGPELQVNMADVDHQRPYDIAALPSGDFVVLFGSLDPDGIGVFARRFFFPLSLAVAPGPHPGNAPRVKGCRPDGQPGLPSFVPYGAGGYGANVGSGRIDADPLDALLTGPGPSPVYGPHVRAFRVAGVPVAKVSFYGYGTLRYGAEPTGADLDGDAFAELVTTPGPGEVFGPHVRGFDYDGSSVQPLAGVSFFAFSTPRYGANGSGAELDADGFDELLATPGPGPTFGAQVRGFDVDGASVRAIPRVSFVAHASGTHGATVAAADIESDGAGSYGDGFDEILTGKGPAAGLDDELRVHDYDDFVISLFFRETPPFASSYGLGVAGGDVDAGDVEEVVTSPGPDPAAPARVLAWEMNPELRMNGNVLRPIALDDFLAYSFLPCGAKVAVGTFE